MEIYEGDHTSCLLEIELVNDAANCNSKKFISCSRCQTMRCYNQITFFFCMHACTLRQNPTYNTEIVIKVVNSCYGDLLIIPQKIATVKDLDS